MNLARMPGLKEWTDACCGRGESEERLALTGQASLGDAFVSPVGSQGEAG